MYHRELTSPKINEFAPGDLNRPIYTSVYKIDTLSNKKNVVASFHPRFITDSTANAKNISIPSSKDCNSNSESSSQSLTSLKTPSLKSSSSGISSESRESTTTLDIILEQSNPLKILESLQLKSQKPNETKNGLDLKLEKGAIQNSGIMKNNETQNQSIRRQEIRFEGDLYTPRYVRFENSDKQGLCHFCHTISISTNTGNDGPNQSINHDVIPQNLKELHPLTTMRMKKASRALTDESNKHWYLMRNSSYW